MRFRDSLVRELAQQVLGVACLEAGVGQMDVALSAGPRMVRRRRSAAGVPEAASGVVQHRESPPGEEDVVVPAGRRGGLEIGLAATPAVQHHDGRKRPVSRGGQGDIGVEGDAIEGRYPVSAVRGRAEAHPVLRLTRVAERRRLGECLSAQPKGRGESRDRCDTQPPPKDARPCERASLHADEHTERWEPGRMSPSAPTQAGSGMALERCRDGGEAGSVA